MALSQKQLLKILLGSVDASGWQALVVDAHKPFGLRIFQGESPGFDLRAYIWTCTHGGGAARAADEFRIQITGVVPEDHAGAITVLLGWHPGYEVFAAWDMRRHAGQDSHSPSAQIKEGTLQQAHTHRFAIQSRENGEIAVAFRPEFFVEYALHATELHRTGKANEDYAALNDVEGLTDAQIDAIANPKRRKVIATIVRNYRASDFRQRVLGAYKHRCSMCGIQLELIEAAHIVPVASDRGNDDTNNGIALCKLHHAAYDRNLVCFDERYRIEVSDSKVAQLHEINLDGGILKFRNALRPALILPNDRRDYPKPALIREARQIRKWMA